MPEKRTLKRARAAKRAGKSPTTQAGEFVHEEIEHIREGKHGARSTEQAIAIGLSKARRAGVKLPPRPSRSRPKRRAHPASRGALSSHARSVAKRRGPRKRSQAAKKAARTRRRTVKAKMRRP